MRYCEKTKDLISTSYLSMTAKEICEVIKNLGLPERTEKSVQRWIDYYRREYDKIETKRQKFEEWAKENPIKYRAMTLLNGAKQRAKLKGIECTLTLEWIEEKLKNGVCEMTGIKFVIKEYSKREEYLRIHPHSPSLDQILPSKGYTKENVQVVCDQFNKMKNDKSIDETYYLAKEFVNEYERKLALSISSNS